MDNTKKFKASPEFREKFMPAANALVEVLKGLYPNWKGLEQLQSTPDRLVDMFAERCWSAKSIREALDSQVKAFDDAYSGMVVMGPSKVFILCPHHLLPCELAVTVGVLPAGKVLGASKFARIADILGRRPIMQETYTTDLAEEIHNRLNPQGTAVYVVGSHSCMTSRGIKQSRDNQMSTCCLKGKFLSEPSTKEEFMLTASRRNLNG